MRAGFGVDVTLLLLFGGRLPFPRPGSRIWCGVRVPQPPSIGACVPQPPDDRGQPAGLCATTPVYRGLCVTTPKRGPAPTAACAAMCHTVNVASIPRRRAEQAGRPGDLSKVALTGTVRHRHGPGRRIEGGRGPAARRSYPEPA